MRYLQVAQQEILNAQATLQHPSRQCCLGNPFGTALAWSILIIQTVCSLALIVNRFVVPACIGHIVIIAFGLIHFHAPNGWYVVGPGTGGMEWGFILLSSLLGVLCSYWPRATPV